MKLDVIDVYRMIGWKAFKDIVDKVQHVTQDSFFHSHLDFFHTDLGAVTYNPSIRFQQDLTTVEKHWAAVV